LIDKVKNTFTVEPYGIHKSKDNSFYIRYNKYLSLSKENRDNLHDFMWRTDELITYDIKSQLWITDPFNIILNNDNNTTKRKYDFMVIFSYNISIE